MNQNKVFLNVPLQKAAELPGVAGEFRCRSLHRSPNPSDYREIIQGLVSVQGVVSDAG
jgi:hypothetical protein